MSLDADSLLGVMEELQNTFPGKSITRDFFRENTEIPDRIWIKHFGTFPEFKKQSGLLSTRMESRTLNKLAQGVERERMRDLGQERKEWSTAYPFFSGKRFQTFLVISDVHDEQCDPFFKRMTLQAAEDTRPDKVIFNGDLFDHYDISHYGKRYGQYDPVGAMKVVHDYVGQFRTILPNAEINLVEGNHEYRLIAHLTEKSPYVMDMLNASGIGVKEFLGLKEFGVNYYARADFANFTESDIRNQIARNYYQFEDFFLCHHFPQGKKFGMPGCSGHHHKLEVESLFNKTYGSYNWFQTGGGARRHVDYMNTMGEFWNNGFMIVTVDTENVRNTMFNYVDCTHEHCVLNGVIYSRSEDEKVYLVE